MFLEQPTLFITAFNESINSRAIKKISIIYLKLLTIQFLKIIQKKGCDTYDKNLSQPFYNSYY